MLAQEMKVARGQISAADDPQRGHFLRAARANPVETPHRHRCDKRCTLIWPDQAEPVWLVLIARQLGDELVVGHPGTGSQAGFGLDPGADQFGNSGRGTDPLQVFGDVEIGLIKAQRLDVGGVVQKDFADLARYRAVDRKAWRAENQLRAEPLGSD